MQQQLDKDLKTALLSGDKIKSEVIKSLKNALQYEAVRLRISLDDLNQHQVEEVFSKEAKKRQEAADLYKNAGQEDRANAELSEKAIIDAYLPDKLSDQEVAVVVDEEISKLEKPSLKDLGIVIHAVKQQLQSRADGGVVAKLAKERLENK